MMESNPLSLSLEGAAFIAGFEGFRATPYLCPARKWTVGYGHVLQKGELLQHITREQALILLQRDAQREAEPVSHALTVALEPYQQDAIISLAYNCGGTAISDSTLVRRLNEGEGVLAAWEFLKWNRIGAEVSEGLTRRRKAEAQLFLTGEYQYVNR
jgi:lysozyme